MKKFLFLVGAILASVSIHAQFDEAVIYNINFEGLPLAHADTFYNGSDLAGGFEVEGFRFQTDWDTDWEMWTGFAYSNMTDVTTPGFMNQFSAITGSGAGNSEQYVVFTNSFTGDTLWLPEWENEYTSTHNFYHSLAGASITNTTYAYLSMKDGDAYGKQFGSTVDANGDEDGTEGKDFFYVTFNAHDENGAIIAAKDVYLADFRDEDPANHYILNTWKDVDFYFPAETVFLTFSFTSSDNGEYGMNTPGYFAMDNLKYAEVYETVATNELEQNTPIKVYPNPANDVITIADYEGEVAIYSIDGTLVRNLIVTENESILVSDLNQGVYFLNVNNQTIRFIKK